MVHYTFREYIDKHDDLSCCNHYDYFTSVPEMSETNAYVTDKKNGSLRAFWDKKKLQQEIIKSQEEAEAETIIAVNNTTKNVMRYADKNGNHLLGKLHDNEFNGSQLRSASSEGVKRPQPHDTEEHRSVQSNGNHFKRTRTSNESMLSALGLRKDAPLNNSVSTGSDSSYVFEPTESMRKAEEASDKYFLHYFVGGGREDSKYEEEWRIGDINITEALLGFRGRIAKKQSLIKCPHQKLAVNFIFLFDSKFDISGLTEEIEDDVWRNIWISLSNTSEESKPDDTIVKQNSELASALASMSQEDAKGYLRQHPADNDVLHSIYTNAASTRDLWIDELRNEDSFVKMFISPLLDAVFGDMKSTSAKCALVPDKEMIDFNPDMFPDYQISTRVRGVNLSVVLLEAKVLGRQNPSHKWDDKSKLGNMMKIALDSILELGPPKPVKTFGILVNGVHIKLYDMSLNHEAVYMMRRRGQFMVPSNNEDFFSIARVHQLLVSMKSDIETTVKHIDELKSNTKMDSLIPKHWQRPSYGQPIRTKVPVTLSDSF
ncbi:hypothetical protein BGZ76_009546 [Entomortierella beljakovae]|nr:hypothetical protein BGZ76_009546 [Entomortierella beljakovae]